MHEEYESIMKSYVSDVVPRPEEKVVVTSKSIYKTKNGFDAGVEMFKERFIARGLSKKEGIDYDEIFALMA